MEGVFRYQCLWEEFYKTVNKLDELIKNGSAYLCIGMKRTFKIELRNIELLDKSMIEIIEDEISFLLYQYLEDGGFDEDDLRVYFSEEEKTEEEIALIIKSVKNKYELAVDTLLNEDIVREYQFKNKSIQNKISNIQTDVCNYVCNDEATVNYALLQITTNKQLINNMSNNVFEVLTKDKDDSISFVCTARDLDYLIDELSDIRRKIK